MAFSFIRDLICTECGKIFSPFEVATFCQDCEAPLWARYDLEQLRQSLSRETIVGRSPGLWRWHELLPVFNPDNLLTLGEGDTPTLSLPRLGKRYGLPHLHLKDEAQNPTATFKARGQAVALAKARELGIRRMLVPSAGNAAGAMAAYAARAGLEARVLVPVDTPHANVKEARVTGAQVILVNGLISDAAREAASLVEEGWFDVSTFKEPYRLEGKKTMGFEIAQVFGWQFPDVIVYPAGGGIGLVGIWKAYQELRDLGWLKRTKPPRLVAVQAKGCAPFVRAFAASERTCTFWENAQTIASGLRVPKSFGDRLVLRALYESNGFAIAVSDEEIQEAQETLAHHEGIFAAPEGAATLAALPHLLEGGYIHPGEHILLLNTGSGLKYL